MPRAPFLALLALLLPLCTTTASVPHEEYELEVSDLRGTWRVISVQVNGREKDVRGEGLWRLVVRQDQVTVIGHTHYYKLDPGRRPWHIDVFQDKTPGARPVTRGIYHLNGNRLTICWGTRGARPKAFVSRTEWDILVELVRVK